MFNMIIFSLAISGLSLLYLVVLFFTRDSKDNKIINISYLDTYIRHNIKKRKIKNNNGKYNSTTTIFNKVFLNHSENEVKYKKLQKMRFARKFLTQKTQKQQVYIEKQLYNTNKRIYSIAITTQNYINNKQATYRTVNNECIIETVAKSYAHAILLKDSFNVFESFKTLTTLVKVYKKEAEVLPMLIIKELINIYIKLLKDTLKIKCDVLKGKHIKRYNKYLNCNVLYGIYLFNPVATKILENRKQELINATTIVINELDEILNKQRVIYNYIKFLDSKTN